MGSVSSSASLLGFEDRAQVKPQTEPQRPLPPPAAHLVRHPSLSTILEERTSQLHDTVASDERAEVSFSFDGKEVSVSLYETPDLTEEEALQVVEMYAEELSEHISGLQEVKSLEHNVVELPPMRFVKETSQSGHLLMEAVVIDVSPEYYASAEDRTEADLDEFSITEDNGFMSPQVITPDEMPFDKFTTDFMELTAQLAQKAAPTKPPRKRGNDNSESSYHSVKEAKLSPEEESSEFADALSSIKDKSQKENYSSAKSVMEESGGLPAGRIEQEPESKKTDISSQLKDDKLNENKKSRKKSRSRSRSAEVQADENVSGTSTENKSLKRPLKKRRSTDSEKEDDSLREFERQKSLNADKEGSDLEKLELKSRLKKKKSSESEREDDSLQEFESRKSFHQTDKKSEAETTSKSKAKLVKKQLSDSSGREDDSLIEYEKKKVSSEGATEKPLKSEKQERQKAPLYKSISTDSSEKDEAYEVGNEQSEHSRKRKKRSLKKSSPTKKDNRTSETNVEIPHSSEAESCDRESLKNKKVISTSDLDRMRSMSDLDSIGDKSRAQEEEDRSVDFDTAEDSAYDKSEMSVLESLTHSIKEIKKSLVAVEETIISESTDEPQSAMSSLSAIESLALPINEIQRGLMEVEKQAEETEAGQYSPSSILETLKEPIQELGRNLAEIEKAKLLESDEESLLKRTTQTLLEKVSHPLHELQKELTFIQQQAIIETGEQSYSDVLQSFKPSLLVVQGGVEQTEGDFTSKFEDLTDVTVFPQGTFAQQTEQIPSSVEELKIQEVHEIKEHNVLVPSTVQELEVSLAETAISLTTLGTFDLHNELEVLSAKLEKCSGILRDKVENTIDGEIKDILVSVGQLVTPLEQFKNVIGKCLRLVDENDLSNNPQVRSSNMVLKATLESPVHALGKCLHLLEAVSNFSSNEEVRGLGIKILYKLSFPLEELKTTMKLTENLSEHTSIELLVSPVENLIAAASVINLEASKSGFAENIPVEGGFIVTELHDSVGVLLKSLTVMTKSLYSQSSLRTLSSLVKPLTDLQNSLHKMGSKIKTPDECNTINTSEIYDLAQELCKPLQAIRTELSIAQHEIELDQYSQLSLTTGPSMDSENANTTEVATNIVHQSLDQMLKSVLTCTEFVLSKSPSETLYVRYLLFALNELILPVNQFKSGISKAEECFAKEDQKISEPNIGISAVASSASELLSVLSELRNHSLYASGLPEIQMIRLLCTMEEPLLKVERGLCKVIEHTPTDDKNILNINMLKTLAEPLKCLQKSLINIYEKLGSESASQGVVLKLRQLIQELQRSILIIQDQVSFEYGDEPTSIESNIDTLQSLVNPLNAIKKLFVEFDVLMIDRSQSTGYSKTNENLHSIIKISHELQMMLSSIMVEENYINKHSLDSLDMFPIFQDISSLLTDLENAFRRIDLVCQNETNPDITVYNKLCEAVSSIKNENANLYAKITLASNKATNDKKHPVHLVKKECEHFINKFSEISKDLEDNKMNEPTLAYCTMKFYQDLQGNLKNFSEFIKELEKASAEPARDSTDISLLSSSDTIKDVNTIMEEVTETRVSLESVSLDSCKNNTLEKAHKEIKVFCELFKSVENTIVENIVSKENQYSFQQEGDKRSLAVILSLVAEQLHIIETYINVDQEALKSANCLANTIHDIQERLSSGDQFSELSILQALNIPFKTFKDNISKALKTMNVNEDITPVSSYLDKFEKSASDLELGLMKLEHALLNSTGDFSSLKNIDIEVLAHPIEELVCYINTIEGKQTSSSETLAEQSSLSMLKTLAQPIREIQEGVLQIQEQIVFEASGKTPSGKSCAGILYEIAKPIRELRSGVALIQEQIVLEPDVETLSDETRVSSLQTFAAPIEEMKRVLSTITEQQPLLFEADVESMSENISLLKTIAQPVKELQNKLATIEINQMMESDVEPFYVKENILALAKPVQTLQESIAWVESQMPLETTGEDKSIYKSIAMLKEIAKPIMEISKGIAVIFEQQLIEEGNLEDVTSISEISTLANITDVSLGDAAVHIDETVPLEHGISLKDNTLTPQLAKTTLEENLKLVAKEQQQVLFDVNAELKNDSEQSIKYEQLTPTNLLTVQDVKSSVQVQELEILSDVNTLSISEEKTLLAAEPKLESQNTAVQGEFQDAVVQIDELLVENLAEENAVLKDVSLNIAAQVLVQETLSNAKPLTSHEDFSPTDVTPDTITPCIVQGELQQSLADVESLETEEETLDSISIQDTSFILEPNVIDFQQPLSLVEDLTVTENMLCEAEIERSVIEAVQNANLQTLDKEASFDTIAFTSGNVDISVTTPNIAVQGEMQQAISNLGDIQTAKYISESANVGEMTLQCALQVESQQVLSNVDSFKAESVSEKCSQTMVMEESHHKNVAVKSHVQEFLSVVEQIEKSKNELQANVTQEPLTNEALKQEVQQALEVAEEIIMLKCEIEETMQGKSNVNVELPDMSHVLSTCKQVKMLKETLQHEPKKHPEIDIGVENILELAESLGKRIEGLQTNTSNESTLKDVESVSTKADDSLNVGKPIAEGKSVVSTSETDSNDRPNLKELSFANSKDVLETQFQQFVHAVQDVSDITETFKAKTIQEPAINHAVQQEFTEILTSVNEIINATTILESSAYQEGSFKLSSQIEIQQVLLVCDRLDKLKDAVEAKLSKEVKIYSALESELQQILTTVNSFETIKNNLTASIKEIETTLETANIVVQNVLTSNRDSETKIKKENEQVDNVEMPSKSKKDQTAGETDQAKVDISDSISVTKLEPVTDQEIIYTTEQSKVRRIADKEEMQMKKETKVEIIQGKTDTEVVKKPEPERKEIDSNVEERKVNDQERIEPKRDDESSILKKSDTIKKVYPEKEIPTESKNDQRTEKIDQAKEDSSESLSVEKSGTVTKKEMNDISEVSETKVIVDENETRTKDETISEDVQTVKKSDTAIVQEMKDSNERNEGKIISDIDKAKRKDEASSKDIQKKTDTEVSQKSEAEMKDTGSKIEERNESDNASVKNKSETTKKVSPKKEKPAEDTRDQIDERTDQVKEYTSESVLVKKSDTAIDQEVKEKDANDTLLKQVKIIANKDKTKDEISSKDITNETDTEVSNKSEAEIKESDSKARDKKQSLGGSVNKKSDTATKVSSKMEMPSDSINEQTDQAKEETSESLLVLKSDTATDKELKDANEQSKVEIIADTDKTKTKDETSIKELEKKTDTGVTKKSEADSKIEEKKKSDEAIESKISEITKKVSPKKEKSSESKKDQSAEITYQVKEDTIESLSLEKSDKEVKNVNEQSKVKMIANTDNTKTKGETSVKEIEKKTDTEVREKPEAEIKETDSKVEDKKKSDEASVKKKSETAKKVSSEDEKPPESKKDKTVEKTDQTKDVTSESVLVLKSDKEVKDTSEQSKVEIILDTDKTKSKEETSIKELEKKTDTEITNKSEGEIKEADSKIEEKKKRDEASENKKSETTKKVSPKKEKPSESKKDQSAELTDQVKGETTESVSLKKSDTTTDKEVKDGNEQSMVKMIAKTDKTKTKNETSVNEIGNKTDTDIMNKQKEEIRDVDFKIEQREKSDEVSAKNESETTKKVSPKKEKPLESKKDMTVEKTDQTKEVSSESVSVIKLDKEVKDTSEQSKVEIIPDTDKTKSKDETRIKDLDKKTNTEVTNKSEGEIKEADSKNEEKKKSDEASEKKKSETTKKVSPKKEKPESKKDQSAELTDQVKEDTTESLSLKTSDTTTDKEVKDVNKPSNVKMIANTDKTKDETSVKEIEKKTDTEVMKKSEAEIKEADSKAKDKKKSDEASVKKNTETGKKVSSEDEKQREKSDEVSAKNESETTKKVSPKKEKPLESKKDMTVEKTDQTKEVSSESVSVIKLDKEVKDTSEQSKVEIIPDTDKTKSKDETRIKDLDKKTNTEVTNKSEGEIKEADSKIEEKKKSDEASEKKKSETTKKVSPKKEKPESKKDKTVEKTDQTKEVTSASVSVIKSDKEVKDTSEQSKVEIILDTNKTKSKDETSFKEIEKKTDTEVNKKSEADIKESDSKIEEKKKKDEASVINKKEATKKASPKKEKPSESKKNQTAEQTSQEIEGDGLKKLATTPNSTVKNADEEKEKHLMQKVEVNAEIAITKEKMSNIDVDTHKEKSSSDTYSNLMVDETKSSEKEPKKTEKTSIKKSEVKKGRKDSGTGLGGSGKITKEITETKFDDQVNALSTLESASRGKTKDIITSEVAKDTKTMNFEVNTVSDTSIPKETEQVSVKESGIDIVYGKEPVSKIRSTKKQDKSGLEEKCKSNKGKQTTVKDQDNLQETLFIVEKEDSEHMSYLDESSTSDYGSESHSEPYQIRKSQSYSSRQWIGDSKTRTEDVTPRVSSKLTRERKCEEYGVSEHEKISYSRRQNTSKPLFCGRLVDRTAAQGTRFKVTCSLTGSPDPTVQWYKDGHLVDTSLDHRYRTRLSDGLASLEITDAKVGDSGKYTCVASNPHGETSTTANIKVFSYMESAPEAPVFTQHIRDHYKSMSDELVIECRVKGHPLPSVMWTKDGQPLRSSSRYQQSVLTDGTCRLVVHGPEPADSGLYKCTAENAVWSEQTSANITFDGRDKYLADSRSLTDLKLPRITNIVSDTAVREGGTVALQVAIKGTPRAEVTWYRGSQPLPKRSSRFRYLEDAGVYSLVMTEASASEAGIYTCRASNAHGYRDTSVNVEIVGTAGGSTSGRGKPAMFLSRPDTSMSIAVGEDVSISFRVSGDPKPRVSWMKGMRDITNNLRTLKETVNDYVRLTLKHATVMDAGTYFIMAKNIYGADHAFVTVRVKQRARSLTPTRATIWSAPDTSTILKDIHESTRALVNDVPGPISSAPVVSDCGKNWLSLSWGKPEHRGAAPVLAYKVESWLLGTEGGAHWTELGVTPINSFDVFFLKPGSEYQFRITTRNRYGWGESVTTTEPISVGNAANFPPDIVRDLPGPLKALQGDNVTLECEINGDPPPTIQWLRDGQNVGTVAALKGRVFVVDDQLVHRLIIKQLTEDDSGRYVCEAVNKVGRASTYARLLVVTDPRLLDADRKLKESLLEQHESAPQITMRLRDRRVQASYPVRLSCQVIGSPAPTVTWASHGQPITADDRHQIVQEADHFHTLEICRTLLEDSGEYTMTAQNCLGAVSCHCQLVVDKGIRAYISPEFICELSPAVTVREGAELRLFAQVEAYPTVSISWQRDGVRLRPSRRLVMTLDPEGRVELALAHLTERDAGLYTCSATNAVGRAETVCQVFVTGGTPVAAGVPTITTSNVPYSKEPRFVTKPRSSEAVEGDTVVITCEVVGDPRPEVMWLRDWLKPGYYRDAPQFRQVGDGSQYSLEIPQVKLDFTGTYCVIARNTHGETKAIISLQIYAKGQGKESSMVSGHVKHGQVETLPEIKRELKDLRCCDGDAVTLECLVSATPLPSVRWEKDGKILPLGEDIEAELDGEVARLIIKKVYPEDEGQYSCVAYNDLGRAVTTACLVVDVPEEKETLLSQQLTRPPGLLSARSTPRSTPRNTPSPARSLSPTPARYREFSSPSFSRPKRVKMSSPKFYTVPHNRIAEEGETVRFQCSVAGHPTPWASWDKDGHIVTPSSRLSVTERDDLRTLELREVTVEDAGLYRVTLENEMGSIEATARLDIIGRQGSRTRSVRAWSAVRSSPTFGRRLVGSAARVGGTFTLNCDVHASPSPVTSWYRNGEMLVKSSRVIPTWDGRRAKLELHSLQPEDAGVYTCVAENAVGTTQCSAELRVLQTSDPSDADLQPPVFLQGLPPEQTAAEGQPFELQVRLQGSSPLEVVWVKDGVEVPDCPDLRHVDYGDGRFGLRIADVFVADGGIYNCEAFNNHGDAITSGHLIVNDLSGGEGGSSEPEIVFTKTPSPVLARLRGKASFCARLQSRPLSHTSFSWTVNGRSVNSDDRFTVTTEDDCSMLHVGEVHTCDMGAVTCTARVCSPGVPPTTVSCDTTLGLDPSPGAPAELLRGPSDTTAMRGDRVLLKATYRGDPEPSVRWLKAGRELSSEGRVQITSRDGVSCLTISAIDADDSGKYVVSVENIHGADCHFASVAVEGPPEAPAARPSVSAAGPGCVTVAWSSPAYDGGCVITGYSVEMRTALSHQWNVVADRCHSLSHVVRGLTPGQTYLFRVRAENIHGASESSAESFPFTLQLPHTGLREDEGEGEGETETVVEERLVVPQPGDEFLERYSVHEELGKGRYGVVHKVTDLRTGHTMAAKFVRCIKKQDREKVQEEIDIMNCLRHPKLLQLAAAFDNPKDMVMVMEYISGGELFERVVADDFTLTERDCILFLRQICEGVRYMHTCQVVHLDLKPENIMCHTRTSHRVKIIDFGLAQKLQSNTPVRVLFGTPEFIPPEIINYEPIGVESDMWSVGVICYVLLSGLSPFMGDNDAETFANITRADFDFDDEAFEAISQDAKDFISSLLIKRKEKRLTAEECLKHKWLTQSDTTMNSVKLCTDKLKKFIIRRKWQKTGNAIRALGRMATLSAASRRNSSTSTPPSPRPSLAASRLSSLDEEGRGDRDRARGRVCSERSDSGISDCSSINTSATPTTPCHLLNKKYSICEEPEHDLSSCRLTEHGVTVNKLCDGVNGKASNVSVAAKKRTTNSLRLDSEPAKAPSPTLQKDAKLFGKSENFQKAFAFWKQ
ncbi:titin-like isoform X2 [Macrosteles quadrilineatus]|nr:titin-like isoform X2 [Macrosteles quadrilineatus]